MDILTKAFLAFAITYFSAMVAMIILSVTPATCGPAATWIATCVGLLYLNISAHREIRRHQNRNEKTKHIRRYS